MPNKSKQNGGRQCWSVVWLAAVLKSRSVGSAAAFSIGMVLMLAVVVLVAGCTEPSGVGRYRQTPQTNIILESLGVIDEEPEAFAGARDPAPEDLQADVTEYLIGAGDVVNVSVFELFATGAQYQEVVIVSESGRITLPVIGTFPASGRSELELTDDIVNRLRPHILKNPTVSVVVTRSREKVYSVDGSVPQPGTYEVGGGDFRILKALAQAGSVPQANVDFVYVIREARIDEMWPGRAEAPAGDLDSGWGVRQVEPVGSAPAIGRAGGLLEQGIPDEEVYQEQEIDRPLPGDDSVEQPIVEDQEKDPEQERDELLESVYPTPVVLSLVDMGGVDDLETEASAADLLVRAQSDGQAKPYKVLRRGQKFMLAPVEPINGDAVPTPPVRPPMPQSPKVPEQRPPVQGRAIEDFEGGLGSQEVVRINLKKLRGGDLSQNIVIRAGDTIQVPLNAVGEFYVMGQVARPGAYNLTGRRLTLKHAIASAGPMTALAWPSRCEIIRRVGENRSLTWGVDLGKVMAGGAPDVFLKPDDIVNVGSHPVARWIAVIRQSFRATYGFGFVYDRNFADKDTGN